jgi:hypothetical protein
MKKSCTTKIYFSRRKKINARQKYFRVMQKYFRVMQKYFRVIQKYLSHISTQAPNRLLLTLKYGGHEQEL